MTGEVSWHLARASGIVAWALLAASTAFGLGLQLWPRAGLLDLHRFLGGLSVAFVGLHVGALVADSYVHFGLADVLVPAASDWHPVAVAWGVLAAWLLLAVELTSLARRRLPRALWRRAHLLSFPLFVLATAHLLSAGTDDANRALLASAVAASMGMAFLTVARVSAPPGPSGRLGVAHRAGDGAGGAEGVQGERMQVAEAAAHHHQ